MNKLILIAVLFLSGIVNAQRIRTVNFGYRTYTPPPPGGGTGGGGTSTDGHFDFQIYSAVTASAGVFRYDSTMVRTLFAARQYVFPGTYTAYWDGKDDYGVTVTPQDANYEVRVLSGNIQYTWQGVIGNSSSQNTGPNIHKGGYHTMQGLCFIGSTGYYCTGYGEGASPLNKFNTATPQQRIRFTIQGDVNYVATDGTLVYWGYQDGNSPDNNMVMATNPAAADAQFIFANGTPYGSHVSSGISVMSAPNTLITGMAVQPTGVHLFVARAGQNNLYVLNKTTGAAVRTLGFTNIHGLACDNSNNLWILYGSNTIQKYSVDGSGNLTSLGTIPGTTSPLSIWYGNGLLAVCEGGNSQVVKFFNNTTFAATTTLGTAGGYTTNSDVTNNKFYFSDVNGQGGGQYFKTSFVAWQTDNSYWVQDAGNYRVQHYNSSGTFIDRIQSLGACYSVFIDRGNINRLFIEGLEFEIDYATQMLTGTAGWSLKRSWGPNIPVPTYDGQPRFQTTLSNGRTYGLIRKGYDLEIVEFVTGGQLRFTGDILFQNLTALLCTNGDLQYVTDNSGVLTVKKRALTGFNGSGNPIWSGTEQVLGTQTYDGTVGSPAAIPFFEVMDPVRQKVYWYQPTNMINNSMTTRGPLNVVLSSYNWIWQNETRHRDRINELAVTSHTKMHIGQAPLGATNVWTWQTDKSTQKNYRGDYPYVPYFDCGNLVQGNAGSNACIVGKHIIVGYKGEFWKNSQTNEYNHYYEDGLAIGQFGVAFNEVSGQEAPAEMAGNANTPIVVKDANNDLYLYHGDEGHHAGAHRWKISGINSLREEKIQIKNPTTYTLPPTQYIDLMVGVPFDQALPNGAGGWTRTPTTNSSEWDVWTSVYTPPNGYGYNDISARATMTTIGTFSFEKITGVSTNVATRWKLTGNISWGESNTGGVPDRECWFDIEDETGKVISRITQNGAYQQPTVLRGNAGTIRTADASTMSVELARDIPFVITAEAGQVTFTVGSYTPLTIAPLDGTANWRRPYKVIAKFKKAGGGTEKLELYLKNLWLYRDY